VAAGSATITATSEGKSGSAAITVTVSVPANATVSVGDVFFKSVHNNTQNPAVDTIPVGGTVAWTWVGTAAHSVASTGAPGFTSSATQTGVGRAYSFTFTTAGTYTYECAVHGAAMTGRVVVAAPAPVPVASVTVSPATASVVAGQTLQLTATLKDANGNTLTRTVAWTSSNTSAATVGGSTGLVTGVAAGSATITATSEGKTGGAAVTVTQVPVASVAVSPATASMLVGQTVQLTATPKDASGTTLSGRVVSWASSNTSVATVSSSGLVTGKAAGSATITATSEGKSGSAGVTVTAPPSGGGTPDPTLLPVATTSQAPLTTAYNGLNVPAIAAGGSYLDPTTGVKIYKITSATFPASSSGWWHDYAEGGDEVSLPYTGTTRALLVRGSSGYWIVDFTPGVGVGNGRALTGSFVPVHDQAFAFSSNPATPYYAYVSNGTSVRRLDIRTMTEAQGNGWPVLNESEAVWLQQSENDAFFTWMRGQSGPVIVGYEPSTGTLKTQTISNVDQPQINRNAGVRQVALNNSNEAMLLWDFTQNRIICTTSGDPGPQFNHMAALRDRWMGMNWNGNHNFDQFLPDCSNQNLGTPGSGNDYYANGSWNQHPTSLDDQWAIFSTQGGLVPSGSGWLAPGGMIFVTAKGQRRLLGHPYNTSTNYTTYSFVRESADGRYVMFTSDMNASRRTDVFLAEVPAR